MSEYEPVKLTWTVLLGRWVDFARSAVALPADADGRRLRESVPDVIMLQAVWFALQHLEELDAGQRALGLDRAAVLIEKHTGALQRRWGANALPAQIGELVADARAALRLAQPEQE
ncbi:MAG: hypothetical protein WD042_03570 [Phycisphaeraceae bacterium]